MKIFLSRCAMALIMLACLARPVTAGEDDISPRAMSYLRLPLSTVRVATEETKLYAEPDTNSAPVWSVQWMQELPVDSKRMSSPPAGWIAIEGTGGKKAAKGEGPRPDAWIRRRDVVIAGDYKKVVGCWPVRSVVYVGGDYAAEVTFKLDGSASAKEWGDEPEIDESPPA